MTTSPAHVAILVDVANLRAGLTQGAPSANAPHASASGPADAPMWGAYAPVELARALMRYASQVGRVTLARAYADWSRLGNAARDMTAARLSPVLVPATADGEDRSHIQLTVDALQALFAGDEPEAYLLVTSDATLLPLVQALRADGSEVTVITCASSVQAELSAEADRSLTIEEVLAGAAGQPAPGRDRGAAAEDGEERPSARALAPREGRVEGRGAEYGAPAGGFAASRAPWLEGPARSFRARTEHPTPVRGPEVEFAAYDWSPFVRLIDELEQRLPFVGVRYLVNKVLGAHNCGTDDPRLKREVLNRAQDDGLLEMFPVGNVGDRADPVTACRLDRQHALVLDILGPSTQPTPIDEDPLRRAISPSSGGLAGE